MLCSFMYRWIFPFIGHMGICTSAGVIRDFAGSYFVSEDQMGFGDPTKYLQLEISRVPGGVSAWDRSVQEASEEYKSHVVTFSISFNLGFSSLFTCIIFFYFYSTTFFVITAIRMLL